MLKMINKLGKAWDTASSTNVKVFVGTGKVDEETVKQFNKKYNVKCMISYGLSELLYVTVAATGDISSSAGKPLMGVDINFTNDGLLTIRSPYSFLGYIENGELRKSKQIFETTDIGYFKDGKIFLKGRSDDIVIRGGLNINPEICETQLKDKLDFANYAVSGVQDKVLGEKLVLVIEGKRSTIINKAELNKCLPSDISIDDILFIDNIPLSPTGKIQRKTLRLKLCV